MSNFSSILIAFPSFSLGLH